VCGMWLLHSGRWRLRTDPWLSNLEVTATLTIEVSRLGGHSSLAGMDSRVNRWEN
jgi:hypothetical protein